MRQWIVASGLQCMLWAAVSGDDVPQRFEFRAAHMGTVVEITLYAASERVANRLAHTGFDRIAHLDACLSDYRADSELRKLCAHFTQDAMTQDPLVVSDELYRVLLSARQFSAATNGAFDVTLGPLSRLWRRARRRRELPQQHDLSAALRVVGYEHVQLGPGRQVKLLRSGMRLDLGGIAKGFAADEALRAIRRGGVDRALVNLGGDMAVGGPPPEKGGWRITVLPFGGTAQTQRQLLLKNCGVATSGDVEQHLQIGDQRYSHILDPRTGMALTVSRAVTVVADNATTADALASALSVLGPNSAVALVRQFPHTTAMIWERTSAGVQQHTAGELPSSQKAPPPDSPPSPP